MIVGACRNELTSVAVKIKELGGEKPAPPAKHRRQPFHKGYEHAFLAPGLLEAYAGSLFHC